MKSKSIQIAISVLLTLGGVQVAQADGATELVHTPGGGRLNNASNGLVSGLYKIKIPACTSSWGVSVTTYRYDEPATAFMKLDSPPSGTGTQLQDARDTLVRLYNGDEVKTYSPENSGVLSVSEHNSASSFQTRTERWLYLNISFPAGRTIGFSSMIFPAPGCVPSANASVPSNSAPPATGAVPDWKTPENSPSNNPTTAMPTFPTVPTPPGISAPHNTPGTSTPPPVAPGINNGSVPKNESGDKHQFTKPAVCEIYPELFAGCKRHK